MTKLEELAALAGVELPNANTPLPPSNATYHVMCRETGYRTPERTMVMLCGTQRLTSGWDVEGEHKWFGRDEWWWHKHVNCDDCLRALALKEPNQ